LGLLLFSLEQIFFLVLFFDGRGAVLAAVLFVGSEIDKISKSEVELFKDMLVSFSCLETDGLRAGLGLTLDLATLLGP